MEFASGRRIFALHTQSMEYPCSVDAVSKLQVYMEEEVLLKGATSENGCSSHDRPTLLLQIDQFGICHAPFAPARAYLAENGYSGLPIGVHDRESGKFGKMSVKEL